MHNRKKIIISSISAVLALLLLTALVAFVIVPSFSDKPEPVEASELSAPNGTEAESSSSEEISVPPVEPPVVSEPDFDESDQSDINPAPEEPVPYPDRPFVLLVNYDHPLPDDYEAGELIQVYTDKKRHFQLASSSIMLEVETFEAAKEMFAAAEEAGFNDYLMTSGYRTAEKQAEIYEKKPEGIAAAPGTSEHQTGLAFDVVCSGHGNDFEKTDQFAWLYEHCWEYGFILRYTQEMADLTGISFEPWHYRYVGKEAAAIIHDLGCSLEEYCIVFNE